MSDPWTLQSGSGSRSSTTTKEEWEDWEDDEVLSPITSDGEDVLLDRGEPDGVPKPTGDVSGEHTQQPERRTSQRIPSSAARQSVQRIRRLRSRHRQKAQNARAGIKLVTDMSELRKQQQHMVRQMRPGAENRRTGKFVDAAALKALEGSPSDDSIGTFAWLKRKPTKGKRVERLAVETPPQDDLSPSAGPIVIGFAMPQDSNVIISPQTAVVETPVDFPRYFKPATTVSPKLTSAWSPDTEDGMSPQDFGNAGLAERLGVPAVPSIPRHHQAADISPLTASDNEEGVPLPSDKKNHRDTGTTSIYISDNDDMETPVTLFEEDGSPATTRRKSIKVKGRQRSAMAGSSQSQGWWDQVTSPFAPPTPATPQTPTSKEPKSENSQSQWNNTREEKPHSLIILNPEPESSNRLRIVAASTPTSGSVQPKPEPSRTWWNDVNKRKEPSPVAPRPENVVSGRPPRVATPQMQGFEKPKAEDSQQWWKEVDKKKEPSPIAPGSDVEFSGRPRRVATPQMQGTEEPKVEGGRQWWKHMDKNRELSPVARRSEAESSSTPRSVSEPRHHPPVIIIEDLSPTLRSSITAPTAPQTTIQSEKSALAEEVRISTDLPPPYSPPTKHQDARYRAVYPPGHSLDATYPPSPGPVPPDLSQTMTSQGAINLTDVPLTPPPHSHQTPLPDRPLGSFVPGDHFHEVSGHGPRQKAERQRRRHEKEDAIAWKAGRLWGGRSCFSLRGCFGRPGREGRKRRRVCLGICVTMLVLTVVGVVLGVLLSRQTVADATVPSQWLNLTNFPPIPTGISTVIGPDSKAVTACVQPPTLWSCSLPKEQAESVTPFDASQPSFVFQIQFDNNTRQLWNVTGQEPPRPTPTDPGNTIPITNLTSPKSSPTASPRATLRSAGIGSLIRRLILGRRDEPASSLDLLSEPAPPSFQEMFFLGNTTDGVVSDDKAGEPTPFYITMLRSVNDTVGSNLLTRRGVLNMRDDRPQGNLTAGAGSLNVSDVAPAPVLNEDGTGVDAVFLGFPKQQPLRLYDRGLPTERYGFYTYYSKTLYLKSVDPLLPGGETTPVPADQNGGCLKSEANFLMTWSSVRLKVEIWTRRDNATRLVGGFEGGASPSNGTQPGTMPYPITVTLDTHGGEFGNKWNFHRGVDDRGRIILNDAKLVLNNMNTTGDWTNPASTFNPSFGGLDGGTGGCKCEYTNFVGVNGQT
ncbi:Glycoprotease family protein [Madurella fahalii]|uniref:Glycoprotease family protein n=1 Tax=Madurella fahalii TaxID=1157608 RepID=A0ABQ0G044_9PEZI